MSVAVEARSGILEPRRLTITEPTETLPELARGRGQRGECARRSLTLLLQRIIDWAYAVRRHHDDRRLLPTWGVKPPRPPFPGVQPRLLPKCAPAPSIRARSTGTYSNAQAPGRATSDRQHKDPAATGLFPVRACS